jgi:hypothetical protein
MADLQIDQSQESEEKQKQKAILRLSQVESVANTEDISCNFILKCLCVEASLKSRMWENHQYGSVRTFIKIKLPKGNYNYEFY